MLKLKWKVIAPSNNSVRVHSAFNKYGAYLGCVYSGLSNEWKLSFVELDGTGYKYRTYLEARKAFRELLEIAFGDK